MLRNIRFLDLKHLKPLKKNNADSVESENDDVEFAINL